MEIYLIFLLRIGIKILQSGWQCIAPVRVVMTAAAFTESNVVTSLIEDRPHAPVVFQQEIISADISPQLNGRFSQVFY
jgi:hypothetical protein